MSFSISGAGYTNLPITAGNGAAVQSFKLGDGSTGLRAENGDSITYDPSVKTQHNGIQSTIAAHIGDETLTQYRNGAASVKDERSGQTVSLDDGNLYSSSIGTADRTLLGSASSPEAWQKAQAHFNFSIKSAGMLQDLEKTATQGIVNAPTLQKNETEFGQSDAQGLSKLFDLLQLQARAIGGQSQGKADPLGILGEIKQQLQQPNSGSADHAVDPATLATMLGVFAQIAALTQPQNK